MQRLVAILLVLLLAACSGTTASPVATPSVSATVAPASTTTPPSSVTASVTTPSPGATARLGSPAPSAPPVAPLPTSPLPGTTALVLPPGTVRSIDLAPRPAGSSIWAFPAKPGGPPTGPYVYLGAETTIPFAYHLSVADLGGGSVRTVPVPTQPYESIAYALVDARSLLVLVWRHEGPEPEKVGIPCFSDSGKPIAWRLLVATLGTDGLPTGGWRQLDTGVATRQYADPDAGITCNDPMIPAVAAADGRAAYAVDHPTSHYPAGSRIILRALGSGSVERTLDTATQVTNLALSTTSVAWIESPNALAPGPVTRWRVMRAPLATGQASEVPLALAGHVWRYAPETIVLDGDAVLTNPALPRLGWAIVVRSAGSSVVALNATGTPFCWPLGAVAGVAILACMEEGSDDAIATWSAATGLRVLAGAQPASYRSEIVASGWVAWTVANASAFTQPVLVGVPLAALVAANQPVPTSPSCTPTQTTAIQSIPLPDITNWPALERQSTSMWQDGSVFDPGLGCWTPFYVFAQLADPTTHPVTPEIDTSVSRASTEAFYEQYTSRTPSPKALGYLTIVSISGTVVSFRSSTGATGTFNLASGVWQFS